MCSDNDQQAGRSAAKSFVSKIMVGKIMVGKIMVGKIIKAGVDPSLY